MHIPHILKALHRHFLVEMNPPSLHPSEPGYASFHGTFNGQLTCCAIGLFDIDRILDGREFDIRTATSDEQDLLHRVFERHTDGDASLADHELDFLGDIQISHDDSIRVMVPDHGKPARPWAKASSISRDSAALARFREEFRFRLDTLAARHGVSL